MSSEDEESRREMQDLGNGFLVLSYEYGEDQWVQQWVSQNQWQRTDARGREVFWQQLKSLVEKENPASSAGSPPPGTPLWPWPSAHGWRTG